MYGVDDTFQPILHVPSASSLNPNLQGSHVDSLRASRQGMEEAFVNMNYLMKQLNREEEEESIFWEIKFGMLQDIPSEVFLKCWIWGSR